MGPHGEMREMMIDRQLDLQDKPERELIDKAVYRDYLQKMIKSTLDRKQREFYCRQLWFYDQIQPLSNEELRRELERRST